MHLRLRKAELQLTNKILGKGSYGVVYKGLYNKIPVAVKMVTSPDVEQDDLCEKEAEVMKRLRFAPNIVQLFTYGCQDNIYYFVMTLAEKGSLSQCFGFLEEPQKIGIGIGIDVIKALEYLQGRKLVHRDIKPENILIRADFTAMLADFGLTTDEPSDPTLPIGETLKGSPFYWAPELLGYRTRNTHKSDIYSYGLVLNMIIINSANYLYPYGNKNFRSMEGFESWVDTSKKRPRIPSYVSQAFADLIKTTWAHEPSARPDASELSLKMKNLKRQGLLMFSDPAKENMTTKNLANHRIKQKSNDMQESKSDSCVIF